MKNVIIVLIILLAVGILVGSIGAIIVNSEDKTQTPITKTEAYTTSKNIVVKCSTADIDVSVGQENQVVFDYVETNSYKGKLTVTETDIFFEYDSKKLVNFDWLSGKKKVNVKLPANFSGNLSFENATGEIDADLSTLDINNLTATTSTGEIELSNANIKGNLSVSTATGKSELEDLTVGKATRITASTGDIRIKNLTSSEDIEITAETAKVKAEGVSTAGKFSASLSTGKGVYKVNCKSLSLSSSTGDIEFAVSGATEIVVKASTGDINGSIDAKDTDFGTITHKTSTGHCNLPIRSGSGNSLSAEATTGNINIVFTK